MITRKELVDGYMRIITDRVDEGWQAYMLTFMFDHIPGLPARIQRLMSNEIERVYAKLLPRIVRKPTAASQTDRLPVLLACPDMPVPKHDKKPLHDVLVNDGRHYHGALAVSPSSRMTRGLNEYLNADEDHYLRRPLRQIHAVKIDRTPEVALRYILKQLERGRIGADDILVLPRTLSELGISRLQYAV